MPGCLTLEKDYPSFMLVLTYYFAYLLRDLHITHRPDGQYERNDKQQC